MTLTEMLDTWMKQSQAEDRAPLLKKMLLEAGWKEPAVAPPPPEPTPEPTPTPTPAPSSRTVLWRGTFETDLSEMTKNGGGGFFNSGSYDAPSRSTTQKHSGLASCKMTIKGSGGVRGFRWEEPRANREAYYSAWFFIPQALQSQAYHQFFQFKSRSTGGRNDPVWLLTFETDVIRAGWGWGSAAAANGGNLAGPYSTSGVSGGKWFQPIIPKPVPVGQWFKVEAFLRQSKDFDGILKVWQDGTLVHDLRGIRTSFDNPAYNTWRCANEWAVTNYGDAVTPNPFTIYMDDAEIGVAT